MATSKSRLGKGLAGLIGGSGKNQTSSAPAKKTVVKKTTIKTAKKKVAKKATAPNPAPVSESPRDFLEIPVSKVEPNPYQPRKEFEESQLEDLAESIQSEGLIQPIVVREVEGMFQLIAGERRWRAFKKLKLSKIPARIIAAGNASAASMALIENLQRENLNPIEEAMGYASLIRDFDLTQEKVAERVGKGRATVANSLRLLTLPEEIRGYLATGLLTTGHAKVLLGIEEKQEQVVVGRRIIEDGVSVRATEDLIQSFKKTGKAKSSSARPIPEAEMAAINDIEKRMISYLNTSVALKHAPKKGKIVINYAGNDDLQRILERIGLEDI